jgi:hypothetical protein
MIKFQNLHQTQVLFRQNYKTNKIQSNQHCLMTLNFMSKYRQHVLIIDNINS